MAGYLRREDASSELNRQLRDIVARANNHSLAMLEEMFDFVRHENIHDVRSVNDRAADWATRINLFDLRVGAELANWKAQLAQRAQSAGR
jgi:hypothetical protein